MKKVLSVLLFLSGTMALLLGAACILSYTAAVGMLKFTDAPDVFQAVTLFGVCLVPLAVMQYLAGYWVWTNNSAGITLARFIGLLILMDGITLYAKLHRMDLAGADIVKGIIISLCAFTVKSDKK